MDGGENPFDESRPLPQAPARAASRSPTRSPLRSPVRSPVPASPSPFNNDMSVYFGPSGDRSRVESPRSENPFVVSPQVSPVRVPVRRFLPEQPGTNLGANSSTGASGVSPSRSFNMSPSRSPLHSPSRGSISGSPIRRMLSPDDDDDDAGNVSIQMESSVVSPFDDSFRARPLPTMPPLARGRSQRSNTSTIQDREDDDLLKSKMSAQSSTDTASFSGSLAGSDAATISGDGPEDFDEDGLPLEPPTDGQQPRRNKSMSRKQVRLVKGNLVLDCPIPTKLYSFLPRRDGDEFVYMRYTACTSDPDDFAESGFTIRPAIYDRTTELCVCITMYNEDEVLFTRTLHAVFKNIAYLCQRNKSKVWGPQGWKKVVVTIVSDGRSKINPRVLDCLAAMGVYQDGVAKNLVNGEEVQAHLFEYTAQVSLTPDFKFQGAEKQIVPVQMIFCLKERNKKKINSHRWLFNAFCPQLNPNVVVLLDVGTRPSTPTLYHLWKAFDEDSNVAGACGEIKTMTGKFGRSLLNPLVAAQNFEYKISNIMDKPFESMFGYITVLPGALSAYRFRALENDPATGEGPLSSYFKGEKLDAQKDAGIFEKNMYLAEDRILCWELVAKKNEKWVLKYVKAAKGETDVPESLAELISQRRRWLNGALFAAVYSQTHFRQIWKTDHSPVRKFFLHFEFLFQFVQLIFTFFSIANYYLAVYFVAGSVAGKNDATIPHHGGEALFIIVKYLLTLAIAAQFVLSLGNRPQGSQSLFMTTVVILSCVTLYVMVIGFYFVAKTFEAGSAASTSTLLTLVVSLLSTYGIYGVMSFLYLDPWHVFTSALQYFLLVPAYVCTLQTYAFCNTHDVTWGTKGDNEQKMDLGEAVVMKDAKGKYVEVEMPAEQVDIDTGYENALHCLRERTPIPEKPPSADTIQMDYFREIRSRVVLVWMVCNLLLVMLVTQFCSINNPGHNVYLQIVMWSMAVFAGVRAIGSCGFLIQQCVRAIHKTHLKTSQKFGQVFKKESSPS